MSMLKLLNLNIAAMQTDPMRFVSGGDDCTVRLWSIREEAPTAVIDAKANVCSVQFSPVSSNLLAFGSANYRVYLYDLRQMQVRVLARCCICCGLLASAHLSRVWRHQDLSWVGLHLPPCLLIFVLGPPFSVHMQAILQ